MFFALQTAPLEAQSNNGLQAIPGNDPVSVMSYNLRYDNPNDGDNRWELRRDQIVNLIGFHNPDFIGTQEGLMHQLTYLDEQLPQMKRIGVGRNDGAEEGEFSAIYYNQNRFELVAGTDSTIWLSEYPSLPSKSWDAALPRILTFGRFRDLLTSREFYMFNTHFDHVGIQARWESAYVVLKTVMTVAGELPVILTGDFNADPESTVYAVLTSDTSVVKDAFHLSGIPHIGPEFSNSGFQVNSSGSRRRIDYIFVSEQVTVLKHAIISTFRNGVYPSDHLPVFAAVSFERDE